MSGEKIARWEVERNAGREARLGAAMRAENLDLMARDSQAREAWKTDCARLRLGASNDFVLHDVIHLAPLTRLTPQRRTPPHRCEPAPANADRR